LFQYFRQAETKPAKTALVVALVEHVRANGGHFLRLEEDASSENCGCWVDIGDFLARDKVSHSLRDQINHQARRKSKLARKQQQQSNHEQQLLKAQEKAARERFQKPSILEIQYDSLPQYVDIPAALQSSEANSSSDISIVQALSTLAPPEPTMLSPSVTNYDYRHAYESLWRPIDEEQADCEWQYYDCDGYYGNQPVVVFEM
jgi:hypothetical protein